MKRKSVSAILSGILVLLSSSAVSAQGLDTDSTRMDASRKNNMRENSEHHRDQAQGQSPRQAPGQVRGNDIGNDNTGMNKGDRSNTAATADQQAHEKKDVEITQQIRRDLMKDDNLSTYAKNIKVVTSRGKVVVKGPVRNSGEQTAIDEIAKNIAGEENVQNQTTITR